MKYIVQLDETCLVTWRFEVDADSPEHAKRRVRKERAQLRVTCNAVQPVEGYPTMMAIVGADELEQ